MNDETTDKCSLESIGVSGVIDAALSILGFEIASVGEPEEDGGWPTLTLDPCIDYEWGGASWGPGRSRPPPELFGNQTPPGPRKG